MHDVLVVGLGAMGSAALYHLASRGSRVIGVDSFDPPHSLGSTHGRSRIIREAYFEHPSYVPLVRRAYENWAALERASGETLFTRTGGLMMGPPECALIAGTLDSVSTHGIDIETLSAAQIVERFPAFRPASEMIGVFERNAGMLFPEACVRAYLRLAAEAGADVRTGTRVTSLSRDNGVVTAETNHGAITARRVIVAAGAWSRALMSTLGIDVPLTVERQTMHWLEPADGSESLGPDRFPIAIIEHAPTRMFYVMPDLGDGVKAAIHYEGALTTADTVEREVTERDTRPVLELARRFVPSAAGRIRESAVCMYTNTPDLDFIVDTVHGMPEVVLVSACSGHGFKFASAIGEAVAEMSLGESASADLSHFRVNRW
ncbi:MAG: N-methyl-L-tryptophan oxidase [Gemmatimonadaceae bacterium]